VLYIQVADLELRLLQSIEKEEEVEQ